MPSTDTDGTPILILRREEIVMIWEMLRYFPVKCDDGVAKMLAKLDNFLAETGDA